MKPMKLLKFQLPQTQNIIEKPLYLFNTWVFAGGKTVRDHIPFAGWLR